MTESKIENLQRRIDETLKFLKPHMMLINCHMVDYITEDHWNNLIPRELVEEVHRFGIKSAISAFWDVRNELSVENQRNCDSKDVSLGKDSEQNQDFKTNFKYLRNFVENADGQCLKPDENICLSIEHLQDMLKKLGATNLESLKFKDFMSDKKSHEVEALSSIVASMASWSETTHIVELGGGKGFLAAMLVMLYQMPVLNIDCSDINAKGAKERNQKLQKLWPGLLRKAQETKSGIKIERRGRCNRNKNKQNHSNTDQHSESISKLNTDENFKDVKENLLEENMADLSVTEAVISKTLISSLYRHVTEFVTNETDLMKLVVENFSYEIDSCNIKLCLTGLHTCGDLGSTTVRLFQEFQSSSVLCAVPCCYHLLTKQKMLPVTNITNNSKSTSFEAERNVSRDSLKSGFPMSQYMKGTSLGRNARMLASQSVDRVSASQELPSKSLFYRALLEEWNKNHIKGGAILSGKMKNSGNDCENFHDYVVLSSKKMAVDLSSVCLEKEYLDDLEKLHTPHKERLDIFYLLRMCLAPVVESLILVDRLMFLAEKGFDGTVGDSFLVRMFDPVVSPRCYSIVAYRNML